MICLVSSDSRLSPTMGEGQHPHIRAASITDALLGQQEAHVVAGLGLALQGGRRRGVSQNRYGSSDESVTLNWGNAVVPKAGGDRPRSTCDCPSRLIPPWLRTA